MQAAAVTAASTRDDSSVTATKLPLSIRIALAEKPKPTIVWYSIGKDSGN